MTADVPDPLAQLLVPLPAAAAAAPAGLALDLAAGARVVGPVTGAGAGVAAHLQADLDRVLGPPGPSAAVVTLEVEEATPLDAVADGVAPERYRLEVDGDGAAITAGGPAGLARGAATLRALVDPRAKVAVAMRVDDAPRFAWRGLLVDCVRHFMPIDALRRTIDAMAMAKLNVLHLHLTDDQAWRVESRAHPELTERAAPGGHYTLAELATLVAHAADRGVRIVPELDVPGHTAALLVAHPELALGDAPRELPTSYVVPDVSVDHRNEAVYALLEAVLGEWAEVFPDPCVHIGGDEVPVLGADNQAEFTARMVAVLRGHDRTAVVWDEALHPSLPKDVIVQAWRCPAKLHEAVRAGHRAVLSSGWYLDLGVPTRLLHAVDPLADPDVLEGAVTAPWADRELSGAVGGVAAATLVLPGSLVGAPALDAVEAARVLGGEACLWSERVTPRLLDTYLWPAVAAVADRLWSDPAALEGLGPTLAEARLDLQPDLRTWTAVRPAAGPREILAELAELAELGAGGHAATASLDAVELALAALADWCEPVRWYARAVTGWVEANGRSADAPPPGTTDPLDRFVDALVPECAGGRAWRRGVGGDLHGNAFALVQQWRAPVAVLGGFTDGPSRLAEPARLAARLDLASAVLVDVLEGRLGSGEELRASLRELHRPIGGATIAVHAVFRAVVG